jgi:hypothetical protein
MGEVWRAHNKQRQGKRALNREQSVKMLRDAGVCFELKNGGAHVIIANGDALRVDFWPGTGLWRVSRPIIHEERGVRQLIKYLGTLPLAIRPSPSEVSTLKRDISEPLPLAVQPRAPAKKVPALLATPKPPWED